MSKMHSLIVTSTEGDTAIAWYGGSTFTVHDLVDTGNARFGVTIAPAERTAFTFYGDDRGNPPTPEQALSHMLEVLETDDHPAWGDDR